MIAGAAPALAFAVAILAIGILRRSGLAGILVDHPNARSLHERPTPRVGGLGLLAGALPVSMALASPQEGWIAAVAAVLAATSALDDARGLGVAPRLAAHVTAAVIAVALVGPPASGGVAAAIAAVLAITWMTNLFNFMDGADGLAGGMAAIGFACLGIAAHGAGVAGLATACAAVSAASLAFLAFNFPPARIFMGDGGSIPLGFLAGALGWQGVATGAWPAWFPLLAFSPFIADATVTLVRRLAAGEAAWRAHRSHYYQRLVLGGWTHRRLALAQWALMSAAGASALAALRQTAALQSAILVAWLLAYVAMAVAIDRRHPRRPG